MSAAVVAFAYAAGEITVPWAGGGSVNVRLRSGLAARQASLLACLAARSAIKAAFRSDSCWIIAAGSNVAVTGLPDTGFIMVTVVGRPDEKLAAREFNSSCVCAPVRVVFPAAFVRMYNPVFESRVTPGGSDVMAAIIIVFLTVFIVINIVYFT